MHSLEHGAVAILYDPGEVPIADIKKMEAIVADYDDDVLTAPYPNLPDPIVVASWSRKMALSEFDEEAIKEYTDRFRDTEPAPEANGQDCAHGSDDAFEPEEEASPSPSPSPEPSPEDNPKDDKGGNAEGGSGADDNPGGDDGTADKGSGDNSKMDKEQEGN